jgi:hypothetical protein
MTMKRRSLPLADVPVDLGLLPLALPTILDDDLAAAHGSAYSDLAAFAIDIDRLYWLDPEDARLPFGWEVFLTEYYLLAWAMKQPERGQALLTAMCLPLLEEDAEGHSEPPLGGQLVFAVYDAVARCALPDDLRSLFLHWRNAPRELLGTLHELHISADATAERLAAHCLDVAIQPPLAAATRVSLEQIRSGQLQAEGSLR